MKKAKGIATLLFLVVGIVGLSSVIALSLQRASAQQYMAYNMSSNAITQPTVSQGCITGSIGGTVANLVPITGTCSSPGVTPGMRCQGNASDGTLPASWKVDTSVVSNDTITVQVTSLAALSLLIPAKTYNTICF